MKTLLCFTLFLCASLSAQPGNAQADAYEVNDTQNEAFGPVQSGAPLLLTLPQGDPADWFILHANPGNLLVTLTGIPEGTDYDLFLVESGGGILLASQNDSTLDESMDLLVPSTTTLWIKVEPVIGHSAEICTLTASFTQGTPNTPPTVDLLTPQGSEEWTVGEVRPIQWSAQDAEDDSVSLGVILDWTADAGTTWNTLTGNLSNTGSWDWTIPDTTTDSALVRIGVFDSRQDTTWDQSEFFSVAAPNSPPQVTLTSPNGGEAWTAQESHSVTWTASDAEDGSELSIDLEFSLNGGTQWTFLAEDTENSGSHPWTPTDTTSQALFRVTARDSQQDSASDTSDALFSVVPGANVPPVVELIYPMGDEVLSPGDSVTISYSAADAEDGQSLSVDIDWKVGTTDWKSIAADTVNTGSHGWRVPVLLSDSLSVRVRARDSQMAVGESESDLFSVSTAVPPGETSITFGSVPATAEQEVQVPVFASYTGNLRTLDLKWNQSPGLVPIEVTATNRTEAMTLQYAFGDTLSLSLTGTESDTVLAGSDPILWIRCFTASAAGDSLHLTADSVASQDVFHRPKASLASPGTVLVSGPEPSATLTAASIQGGTDDIVFIPVALTRNSSLLGVSFEVSFDDAVLELISVQAEEGGFALASAEDSPSVALKALAGPVPPGSDPLCSLEFKILGGTHSDVVLNQPQILTPGERLLPAEAEQATVTPVTHLDWHTHVVSGTVRIQWEIQSELLGLRVLRAGGNQTTPAPVHKGWLDAHTLTFEDSPGAGSYLYWIETLDRVGGIARFGPLETVVQPTALSVGHVFPNPSSGSVSLEIQGTILSAMVFDAQGRLVRRLNPALHESIRWDGRTDQGRRAPNGLYFLRVRGPASTVTKRVVIAR